MRSHSRPTSFKVSWKPKHLGTVPFHFFASLAFGFFFAVKRENIIFVAEKLIVNYKMTDKEKVLNTILIDILKEVGIEKNRFLAIMSVIAISQLQVPMLDWMAETYEREGALTLRGVMQKLNQLRGIEE